ncbi:hypothetical protein D3C87_2008330 [compost metagenome]
MLLYDLFGNVQSKAYGFLAPKAWSACLGKLVKQHLLQMMWYPDPKICDLDDAGIARFTDSNINGTLRI